MHTITQAKKTTDFKRIATLATTIWSHHYTPIIGVEQVNYMLHKYQSAEAIAQQVAQGFTYDILTYEDIDAGYLAYTKKENALFLSKLYVLSIFRGKGLGKSALAHAKQAAVRQGCIKISLTVNKYNTNSIKAYEKMGFQNVAAIVQDIGEGYIMDDFVLEKVL